MKPIDTYIRAARDKGKTDDEIKNALLAAGWNEAQASEALGQFMDELPPPPPPSASAHAEAPVSARPTPHGMYAWYGFEHILMFISLAVLAVSIALILNYFVDGYFPNSAIARTVYSYSYQNSALRGYLSALLVSLPLFSFLFLDITKRSLTHPEIRNLIVRKLLIYLTLIVTFIMMLGYVIAAVYGLLGGNLSVNFLLHLLVTFATSGTIFTYYLWQVKGDRRVNA